MKNQLEHATQKEKGILESVLGIGADTVRTLLADLPELGTGKADSVCALAEIVPINRDSGKMRGKRSIFDGRGEIRAALYNAAVDEENETQIALEEDFDRMAKEEYEAKTDFKLKNATFEDYLKSRDEKFQRDWLGPKRYELWKDGKLKLDQMVSPDGRYRKTVEELGAEKTEKTDGKKQTNEMIRVRYTGDANSGSVRQEFAIPIHERKSILEITETDEIRAGIIKVHPVANIQSVADVDGYLKATVEKKQKEIGNEIITLKETIASDIKSGKSKFDVASKINRIQHLEKRIEEIETNAIRDFIAKNTGKATKIMTESIERSARKAGLNNQSRKQILSGTQFVGKLIDTANIEINSIPPKIIRTKTHIPTYNKITHKIDIDTSENVTETIIHELAHYLQDDNKNIQSRCQDFILQVATKDAIKSDTFDFMKIKKGVAMPDYALRIYYDGDTPKYGEEILSTGLDMLYKNPVLFHKQYPEFFNFILSLLKNAK